MECLDEDKKVDIQNQMYAGQCRSCGSRYRAKRCELTTVETTIGWDAFVGCKACGVIADFYPEKAGKAEGLTSWQRLKRWLTRIDTQ